MIDTEDALYGRIVSGLTPATLSSFTCTNSTFDHCFRTPRTISVQPINTGHDNGDDDDTITTTKEETSRKYYPARNLDITFEATAFKLTSPQQDLDLSGGAIFVTFTGSQTLDVTDCTFEGEVKAQNGAVRGGAICVAYGTAIVSHSSFKVTCSNSQYCSGGAIYATNTDLTIQTKTKFEQCYVKPINVGGAGGGVYADDSKVTISNSQFTTCQAVSDNNIIDGGGAISISVLSASSTYTISDTSFTDCFSKGKNGDANGGAIRIVTGAVNTAENKITNCNFIRCQTYTETLGGNGGAVYAESTTLTMETCLFTECTTESKNRDANGGAIYATGKTLKLTGCDFTSCTTSGKGPGAYGGGVYAFSATIEFTTCTFTECEATIDGSNPGGDGGGAYLISCAMTLSDCTFEDCESESGSGGGLYVGFHTEKPTVEVLFFKGCEAELYGGGLYWTVSGLIDEGVINMAGFGGNSAKEADNSGWDAHFTSDALANPFGVLCLTTTADAPNQLRVYPTKYQLQLIQHRVLVYTGETKDIPDSVCPLGACTGYDTFYEAFSQHPEDSLITFVPVDDKSTTYESVGQTYQISDPLTVVSTDRSKVTFEIKDTSNKAVFDVLNTLNLQKLTIELAKDSLKGTATLITIQSGATAALSSVTVTSAADCVLPTYLFDIGSGKLSCTSVTVSNFKSSAPLLNTGSLNSARLPEFSDTHFENIDRTVSQNSIGCGSVIDSLPSLQTLTLSGMIFDTCNAANGGAIYLNIPESYTQLTLTSLQFTSCSSTESGGALYISVPYGTKLILSNLQFTSCLAATGGVLHAVLLGPSLLQTNADAAYQQLQLSSLVFTAVANLPQGKTNNGAYIRLDIEHASPAIAASSLNIPTNSNPILHITSSAFVGACSWLSPLLPTTYSSEPAASKYLGTITGGTNDRDFNLLHAYFAPTGDTIVGLTNAVDSPNCGWDDYRCPSLAYAIDQSRTSIVLSSETHTAPDAGHSIAGSDEFTLSGQNGAIQKVGALTASPMDAFYLVTATSDVTISSIEFRLSQPLSGSLSPLLKLTSRCAVFLNKLQITKDTTVTDKVQISVPLIWSTDGAIQLAGVQISYFKTTTYIVDIDGTGVDLSDYTASGTVHTSFSYITRDTNPGPLLRLGGKTGGAIGMTNAQFISCSNPAEDGIRRAILIDLTGVPEVDIRSFDFQNYPSDAATNYLVAVTMTSSPPPSLGVQFILPARSFSISSRESGQVPVTIQPTTPYLDIGCMISNQATLLLQKLDMKLPPALDANHALTSLITSSSVLNLQTLTFAKQGSTPIELSYSILTITDNILTASSVIIEDLSFGTGISPIVISTAAASTDFYDLTLDTLSLSASAISVADLPSTSSSISHHLSTNAKKKIKIRSSKFDTVTTSGADAPSVLETPQSTYRYSLDITDTDFTDCQSTSSTQGGVLRLYVDEGTEVAIEGGEVKGSAAAEGGKGGFLYIDASNDTASDEFKSSPLPVSLKSVDFKASAKGNNNGMFVECWELLKQVTYELFDLPWEKIAEYFKLFGRGKDDDGEIDLSSLVTKYSFTDIYVTSSEDAEDKAECGSEDKPCRTLTESLSHIISGETSNLYVVKNCQFGADASLKDFKLSPSANTPGKHAQILMDTAVGEAKDEKLGYITVVTRLDVDEITFTFGESFSTPYTSFVEVGPSSSLSLEDSSFTLNNIAEIDGLEHIIYTHPTSTLSINTIIFTPLSSFSAASSGLLLFIQGDFSIGQTIFDGFLDQPEASITTHNADTAVSDQCNWSGSLVKITTGSGTIQATEFINASIGALDVSDAGEIAFEERLTLTDNTPAETIYPTFRRNIHCSSSELRDPPTKLILDATVTLDAGALDSLWILNDGCTLEGFSNYASTYFVPVLSSVTFTTQENGDVELAFTGSNLVNCRLQYSLSYSQGTSHTLSNPSTTSQTFTFTSSTSDTSATGTLNRDTDADIIAALHDGTPVSTSLVVDGTSVPSSNQDVEPSDAEKAAQKQDPEPENTESGSDTTVDDPSTQTETQTQSETDDKQETDPPKDRPMSKSSNGNSGLLIIVAAAAGVVVVAILVIVLVCCCCCRKSSSNENVYATKEEYEEEEEPGNLIQPRMVEMQSTNSSKSESKPPSPVEERTDSRSRLLDNEITPVEQTRLMSSVSIPTVSTELDRKNSIFTATVEVEVKQVMQCTPPFEESSLAALRSLGEYLHGSLSSDGLITTTVTMSRTMTMDGDDTIRGRIGAGVSAFECLQTMLQKKDSRAWSLIFHLSPSRIFLGLPIPSISMMEDGNGVYISLDDPTEDEKLQALRYLAPEMETGSDEEVAALTDEQKEKAMVFTMGMILWECAMGEAPISNSVPNAAHKAIQKGYLLSIEDIEDIDLHNIMHSLLEHTPANRPTLSEAINHLRDLFEEDDEEEDDDTDNDAEKNAYIDSVIRDTLASL